MKKKKQKGRKRGKESKKSSNGKVPVKVYRIGEDDKGRIMKLYDIRDLSEEGQDSFTEKVIDRKRKDLKELFLLDENSILHDDGLISTVDWFLWENPDVTPLFIRIFGGEEDSFGVKFNESKEDDEKFEKYTKYKSKTEPSVEDKKRGSMWDEEDKCIKVLDVELNEGECPFVDKPVITVRASVAQRIKYLTAKLDTEWSGVLIGKKTDDGYEVSDLIIPEQKNSGAHTECIETVSKSSVIGWVHSHVNMKPFWSTEDSEMNKELPIGIVVNKDEEYKAIASVETKCKECLKTDAEVVFNEFVNPLDKWYEDGIKEKLQSEYQYSSYYRLKSERRNKNLRHIDEDDEDRISKSNLNYTRPGCLGNAFSCRGLPDDTYVAY